MFTKLKNIIVAVNKRTDGNFAIFSFSAILFIFSLSMYSNNIIVFEAPQFERPVIAQFIVTLIEFFINMVIYGALCAGAYWLGMVLKDLGVWLISVGDIFKEEAQKELEIEPNTKSKAKITFN